MRQEHAWKGKKVMSLYSREAMVDYVEESLREVEVTISSLQFVSSKLRRTLKLMRKD